VDAPRAPSKGRGGRVGFVAGEKRGDDIVDLLQALFHEVGQPVGLELQGRPGFRIEGGHDGRGRRGDAQGHGHDVGHVENGRLDIVPAGRGLVMTGDHGHQRFGKFPGPQQQAADQGMGEADHVVFGDVKRGLVGLGVVDGFHRGMGQFFENDEPADVVEDAGDEESFPGAVPHGLAQGPGEHPDGHGMLPEGAHVEQLRRDVLEDVDGRNAEGQGGNLLAADDHDRPGNGVDALGQTVKRAVDEF